jgi:hypothetical protein
MPLKLREEAVTENDSSEDSSTESGKKLVIYLDDNNCSPSLNQTVDLELPQQPTLSPNGEKSTPTSNDLNVIPPENSMSRGKEK